MTALILYWSLTGTTRHVAERIAEGMRAEGVQSTLHDLRGGLPPGLAEHLRQAGEGPDVVGVGFPVHWYRPPVPVRRAIRELGRLDGRSVFAFSLNGSSKGSALNRARAWLTRAGGTELGAFSSFGEGRFYPYAVLGALFSPDHPTSAELESAQEFGRRIARAHRDLAGGGALPARQPLDARTHPMHAAERAFANPFLTRLIYSKCFRSDQQRCVRCGKCAKACPVGNIVWQRGSQPQWRRDCVLCLQCRTVCPEDAIRCPLDWAVFRPLVRWNVNHGRRDPRLECADVRFERGKFVRDERGRAERGR